MRGWFWFGVILGALGLAACLPTPAPTALPTPLAATPTLTPSAPLIAPTATPDPNLVRVWLPSEFAPDTTLPSGTVLAQQIAAFQTTHPQWRVSARPKPAVGPGALLPALMAAYTAAPAALPQLALLSRDEAVTAHAAGLLAPLDSLLPPDTLTDYYPFAQSMSRIEDEWICLPFAADARLLVYSTQTYAAPPLAWSDIVTGPLIFPGAEATGLSLLSTYLSLGGALDDTADPPLLNTEVLADALSLYQAAYIAGHLPLSTLTYADAQATWQVFRERRAVLAFTSARWYLAEYNRLSTAAAAPLPTHDGNAFALAEGWCWTLLAAAPASTPAVELLRWLNAPEQLAAWTSAADLLPPRAQAVAAWPASSRTRFADNLLRHAQLQPSAEVLARVGLPLHQAMDDVLNGRLTPTAAAHAAAQAIAAP